MDCQKFNKLKNEFINQTIEFSNLDEFLEHYESCKSCREELEINFLVDKILIQDNIDSFNLMELLQEHILILKERKKSYYKRLYYRMIVFLITEILTAACVVYYILQLF